MTKTISTGIDVLDRKVNGGIQTGRVVALSASPVSQSELFLYEMASVRRTTYITTERTPKEIRSNLENAGTFLDEVEIYSVGGDEAIAKAGEILEDLPDESTLILDPMHRLESRPAEDFRELLKQVKDRTSTTSSLTVLHCLAGVDIPSNRDLTHYHSDIVFSLSTSISGGTVKNRLAVPKFRGGNALQETIDLDLTSDVTIDVTRKIA